MSAVTARARVGYPVTQLREQVNQALGLATEHRMVVVGLTTSGERWPATPDSTSGAFGSSGCSMSIPG